jgi:hypothetical protein
MDRFDLYPARLAGDAGYGSAEMLGWLVNEKGIEPHATVFDKSARKDGTFSRQDFTYDHEGDVYRCPGGKMLTCKGTLVNDGATLLYRASKNDCDLCALKPRCCPKAPARKVPRSIYEGARDMARGIAKTDEGLALRRQRKKIEMLFPHLKRILRLDRLRLRGPNGARDEFHLAAPLRTSGSSPSSFRCRYQSQRQAGRHPADRRHSTIAPHPRRGPRRLLQQNRRKADIST